MVYLLDNSRDGEAVKLLSNLAAFPNCVWQVGVTRGHSGITVCGQLMADMWLTGGVGVSGPRLHLCILVVMWCSYFLTV